MKYDNIILVFIYMTMISISDVQAQKKDTTKVYYAKTIKVTAEKDVRIANYSEIAMKMLFPIHETPVSIGIVSNKMNKDQNNYNLSQALKNISSINVQSSLGTNDYFMIRGFESTSAGLILTDGIDEPGISLNKFFGYGFNDLYNIEQVEVLKGPAAFLYGSNTLSGTINLARKQPIFKNFSEMFLSYGKYNSFRSTLDLGVTDLNSNTAFRLNGLYYQSDQFRFHCYNKNMAINPVLTWNPNPKNSFILHLEYIQNELVPDIGIPLYSMSEGWLIPDVPKTTSYQTVFDILHHKTQRIRLEYNVDINKTLKINNRFFFTNLDGDANITMVQIPYLDKNFRWIVERIMYSFDESQKLVGNQFELRFLLHIGSIEHNLLIGCDLRRWDIDSHYGLVMLKKLLYFNPVDTISSYEELLKNNDKIGTKVKNSVFGSYILNYTSFSESLKLYYGGRFDMIDSHYNRQPEPLDFIGNSLHSNPTPFTRVYKTFSPMIGVVFKDTSDLILYANAGQSFAQSSRVIDKPETSIQYEIGFKYNTPNKHIKLSAAIYHLLKENISIPLSGPLQGNEHASNGSQRSDGLELELITRPIQGVFCFFTYAFTDAELINYKALVLTNEFQRKLEDVSGFYPAFVPAHLLNIWITKEFRIGLGFGFGLQHTSDQYVYVDNDFKMDEYITYDALIYYKFKKGCFKLNFNNLTKTEYYTKGLSPYTLIPANPFNITSSVEYSL